MVWLVTVVAVYKRLPVKPLIQINTYCKGNKNKITLYLFSSRISATISGLFVFSSWNTTQFIKSGVPGDLKPLVGQNMFQA